MLKLVFGYYLVNNVGGTTLTNFNHTYLRTIGMQYLRILLRSFEEEDFKGLVNRNQIFAFFHFQNSAKKPVGGVSL